MAPSSRRPGAFGSRVMGSFVKAEKIGGPEGIVSGITRVTKDPVRLKIAETAAKVIQAAHLLRDGFSYQTGAGEPPWR